jgi:methionyl-tRNA synthetase
MSNKVYITTTLPYVNSNAHVGHLLEFIQADFLARYLRKHRREVFFNTGLDEHGVKIYDTAIEKGLTPQEWVDSQAEKWKEFCKLFNISYDNFYRTTDQKHKDKVVEVWDKLKDYIYQENYTGKYCKGCEEFKKDSDLVDGKCPVHKNLELEEVNELNYFLKLTELDEDLIKHIEEKNFIYPIGKKNELLNNIKDVRDLSISRSKDKSPWGIEVPGDENQTIYVWFDALINYINSCGDDEWNDSSIVQLCGPDNIRFQGHIWQSILKAYGAKFTDKLLVHGTILDSEGVKMSKSIGNVIDPIDQLEKYGLDAVRNYVLSLPTFGNVNWNEEDLVDLYNSRLANDFGNLVSRVLHLIDKYETDTVADLDLDYCVDIDTQIADIYNSFGEKLNISEYCTSINRIAKNANKYINDEKPWEQNEGYNIVLSNLYYTLHRIAELYLPIIPNRYEEILKALDAKKKVALFQKL